MMHHLNSNKKKKSTLVTATTAVLIAATIAASPLLLFLQLQQDVEAVKRKAATMNNSGFVPTATSGENVYATWLGNRTGDWEVMFRASNDAGQTFNDRLNLSNSTGLLSSNVSIAAEGENVYVTWWEQNDSNGTTVPVFRASNDNGETFGDIIVLSNNAITFTATNTTTTTDNTTTTTTTTMNTIGTTTATNQTEQMTMAEYVSPPNAPIAVSGDNLYVTWWDNKTGGDWEIKFRASNDNGETFGEEINLSNTTGVLSSDVLISAEGDNVYVTWWEDNPTNNTLEPVIRTSNDNGETFSPLLTFTANGTIGVTEEEGGGEEGEEELLPNEEAVPTEEEA